jgi:hypothetical protein
MSEMTDSQTDCEEVEYFLAPTFKLDFGQRAFDSEVTELSHVP